MPAPRKVALVTGSATGVGRACAARFARLGLAVVVNYSKSEADAQEPGRSLTRGLAGREAHVAKYLEQAPLGRAATPDDIADAVLYLATGTTLTTGQVLVVDGGRTM